MLCFDPDKFAVTGDMPMTTVDLPGKPWAKYGKVRDVFLVTDDLPIRMVTFTMLEMAELVGLDARQDKRRYFEYWGWPVPKYESRNATNVQNAKGLQWKDVKIFTYPEADVLMNVTMRITRHLVDPLTAKIAKPVAGDVQLKIRKIRNELEDTYRDG